MNATVRSVATLALVSVAGAVGWVASLSAQEPRTLPGVGSWGLSFDLPDGGGTSVALRRMLAADRSLGLSLRLGLTHQTVESLATGDVDEQSLRAVGMGADLRFYRGARGPVVPFVQPGALVVRSDGPVDAWALAADLAVGAEWLPFDQVSVSGSAGVRAAWRRSSSSARRDTDTSLGLFRSSLALTLYF